MKPSYCPARTWGHSPPQRVVENRSELTHMAAHPAPRASDAVSCVRAIQERCPGSRAASKRKNFKTENEKRWVDKVYSKMLSYLLGHKYFRPRSQTEIKQKQTRQKRLRKTTSTQKRPHENGFGFENRLRKNLNTLPCIV